MKKVIPLILAVLVAGFLMGCGSAPAEKAAPRLTAEIKAEIQQMADIGAEYYTINRLEERDGTIDIWINLKFTPTAHSEIKVWTDALTADVIKLFDYEVDVSVTAMRTIEGSDKIKAFGRSRFLEAVGKVEYLEY